MLTSSYTIAFIYTLDNGRFNIPLIGEVEKHHSEPHYFIKNIRMKHNARASILPDIQLKKSKGQWVHRDSGKETDLSIAAGKAIEEYENHHKN